MAAYMIALRKTSSNRAACDSQVVEKLTAERLRVDTPNQVCRVQR